MSRFPILSSTSKENCQNVAAIKHNTSFPSSPLLCANFVERKRGLPIVDMADISQSMICEPLPHNEEEVPIRCESHSNGDHPPIWQADAVHDRNQSVTRWGDSTKLAVTEPEPSQLEQNPLQRFESELLLRLADCLWSHCNSVLNRQNWIRSPTNTATNTRLHSESRTINQVCCMTLKDVISVLEQSCIVSSATSQYHPESNAVSKKKLVVAVHTLWRMCPEWIRISNPTMSPNSQQDCGKTELSKDSSVWIAPAEYQTVRTRLLQSRTGSYAMSDKVHRKTTKRNEHGYVNSLLNPLNKKPKWKEVHARESHDYVRQPEHAELATNYDPEVSMTVIPSNEAKETKNNVSEIGYHDQRNVIREKAGSINTSRTMSSMKYNDSTCRHQRNKASSPAPVVTGEYEENVMPTRLRMNPNFILSPADRRGGETISLYEGCNEQLPSASPRSLRSLFMRLNAGKRI